MTLETIIITGIACLAIAILMYLTLDRDDQE